MKIIVGNTLKNIAIKKTVNNSIQIGFCLSDAPSASVTVTLSDALAKYTRDTSSFTFTTANWFTFQNVTLTASNDGVTDIILNDSLIFSCSGGGYDSVTLTLPVTIYDVTTLGVFMGDPIWTDTIHVTPSNYASKAAEAIAYFFNGLGLPSDSVTVTNGFTGAMHGSLNTSSLTNVSSVDKYVTTRTDGDGATWTHQTFHIHASTGNTKLLIDVLGTGSYNHTLLINTCTALGIDILFCGMPVTGGLNVETSSKITLTGTAGWAQMVSNNLDTVSYCPVELFFFDICNSLNYISAHYSYSVIGITGVHAGAWTSLVYGALDSRITKVFPMRGLNPIAFDNVAGPYPLGDNLANNGTRVYNFYQNNVSTADYYIINGLSKYIKFMDNTNDSSSAYATCRYWKPSLQSKTGCTINLYVSTSASTATADYYADYIAEITNVL